MFHRQGEEINVRDLLRSHNRRCINQEGAEQGQVIRPEGVIAAGGERTHGLDHPPRAHHRVRVIIRIRADADQPV